MIHSCMAAMTVAFEKADLIHRDISVGNIVFVRESTGGPMKGYLIDWELACGAGRRAYAPRRQERMVRLPHSSKIASLT